MHVCIQRQSPTRAAVRVGLSALHLHLHSAINCTLRFLLNATVSYSNAAGVGWEPENASNPKSANNGSVLLRKQSPFLSDTRLITAVIIIIIIMKNMN